ncbi:hypothetical protein [Flavobacterium sp. 3HN19-14]|uniref:hypothetical protein n=1 Tax=Flavobacterium sp. 3HN19-14 TaxID=3448133 RepID=UPI003EE4230F
MMFGLSYADTPATDEHIYYCFYYASNGTYKVRVLDVDKTPALYYSDGDRMRIEKSAGRVRFYQNGNVVYDTYDVSPTAAAVVDFAIKNSGWPCVK